MSDNAPSETKHPNLTGEENDEAESSNILSAFIEFQISQIVRDKVKAHGSRIIDDCIVSWKPSFIPFHSEFKFRFRDLGQVHVQHVSGQNFKNITPFDYVSEIFSETRSALVEKIEGTQTLLAQTNSITGTNYTEPWWIPFIDHNRRMSSIPVIQEILDHFDTIEDLDLSTAESVADKINKEQVDALFLRQEIAGMDNDVDFATETDSSLDLNTTQVPESSSKANLMMETGLEPGSSAPEANSSKAPEPTSKSLPTILTESTSAASAQEMNPIQVTRITEPTLKENLISDTLAQDSSSLQAGELISPTEITYAAPESFSPKTALTRITNLASPTTSMVKPTPIEPVQLPQAAETTLPTIATESIPKSSAQIDVTRKADLTSSTVKAESSPNVPKLKAELMQAAKPTLHNTIVEAVSKTPSQASDSSQSASDIQPFLKTRPTSQSFSPSAQVTLEAQSDLKSLSLPPDSSQSTIFISGIEPSFKTQVTSQSSSPRAQTTLEAQAGSESRSLSPDFSQSAANIESLLKTQAASQSFSPRTQTTLKAQSEPESLSLPSDFSQSAANIEPLLKTQVASQSLSPRAQTTLEAQSESESPSLPPDSSESIKSFSKSQPASKTEPALETSQSAQSSLKTQSTSEQISRKSDLLQSVQSTLGVLSPSVTPTSETHSFSETQPVLETTSQSIQPTLEIQSGFRASPEKEKSSKIADSTSKTQSRALSQPSDPSQGTKSTTQTRTTSKIVSQSAESGTEKDLTPSTSFASTTQPTAQISTQKLDPSQSAEFISQSQFPSSTQLTSETPSSSETPTSPKIQPSSATPLTPEVQPTGDAESGSGSKTPVPEQTLTRQQRKNLRKKEKKREKRSGAHMSITDQLLLFVAEEHRRGIPVGETSPVQVATDQGPTAHPPSPGAPPRAGHGAMGLKWAYATSSAADKALLKGGFWLFEKPKTYFRHQPYVFVRTSRGVEQAPVVVDTNGERLSEPDIDINGQLLYVNAHGQSWPDIRSRPGHPDMVPEPKLVEYQACEAVGLTVWRHDRNLLQCRMLGCYKKISDHNPGTIVCLTCGPKSLVRYCSVEHQNADLHEHWRECGRRELLLKRVVDEGTAPSRFDLLAPAIRDRRKATSFPRYRQITFAARNRGRYTLFDWENGDPTTLSWDDRYPRTEEMEGRVERLLNVALLDSTNSVLVAFLYRMLRELLVLKDGGWVVGTTFALAKQFIEEFGLKVWSVPRSRLCECEWVGKNLDGSLHMRTCQRLYLRYPKEWQIKGMKGFVEMMEARYWILRAWGQRHPSVHHWADRAAGDGYTGEIEGDAPIMGEGWEGWGAFVEDITE